MVESRPCWASTYSLFESRSASGAVAQLMSQGGEFELRSVATTNPKREQGTQSGQKREHADDGMNASPKTLCFLGLLEFGVRAGFLA